MADVFVSYSRRDSEFVRRLASSITERGKEIWVDTEGIADGEVFPEAIKRAIEQSDAFLFVITPVSVASAYCEHEVEYARELQKRIVPCCATPSAMSSCRRRSTTATGSRSPRRTSSTPRWGAWSPRSTQTSRRRKHTRAGW
jgi:TIR domain